MLGYISKVFDDLIPANPLLLFKQQSRARLGKEMGGPRGYFKGSMPGGTTSQRAAKTRRIAGYTAGGLLAANTLDINPFGATDMVSNVAAIGGHGAVGMGLMRGRGADKLSRTLGMGYLGLGGMNMLRPGNNMGPF